MLCRSRDSSQLMNGAAKDVKLVVELQCLSRTAVMMQRMLCTILEKCAQYMPASIQLQLLSILQASPLLNFKRYTYIRVPLFSEQSSDGETQH